MVRFANHVHEFPSHAATRSRSTRVVTFRSRSSPSTILTRPPRPRRATRSRTLPRRVAAPRAAPTRRTLRCLAPQRAGHGSASRRPGRRRRASPCRSPASAGTAPSKPSPSASTTRRTTSSGSNGRAASCTRIDRSVVRHLGHADPDRLRSRLAARHAGGHLRGADLLGEQDRRLLPLGRRHEDNRVDPFALVEPPQRLREQGKLTEARRKPSVDPPRAAPLARRRREQPRPSTAPRRASSRPASSPRQSSSCARPPASCGGRSSGGFFSAAGFVALGFAPRSASPRATRAPRPR